MALRRDLLPTARTLVKLAEKDRAEARKAIANLSLEEQVAAICEAPLQLRATLFDLVPMPEEVIPLMPEAELCFTCKHFGVHDASWLLAYATSEQIIACIDLDAWDGLVPDRGHLDQWLASLAEAAEGTLIRSAKSMDPEILALYLRAHVDVELKPSGDDDWQPPDSSQTLEGQFYFVAKRKGDDLAPLLSLLHALFRDDYWLYFRMMQSVSEESTTEIEEWALRWRTGRLEDMGFPSWDASMRVYGFLRSEQLAEVPTDAQALDVAEWAMPVWISELPTVTDASHSIFRAIAELDADERLGIFYAFVSLANKVAVADRLCLGDAETLPRTLDKAARVSSLGLEHVARENGLDLCETVRRVPLDRLFRVGVNLSPEGVRPQYSDAEQDESETDEPTPPGMD